MSTDQARKVIPLFKKPVLYTLMLVALLVWLGHAVSVQAQSTPALQPTAATVPTERAPDTLFSIVFSGGPVGITIMLVLFGVSITAAYLVFEQMFAIRRTEIMPPGLGEEVRQSIIAGNLVHAEQLCRARPSFLSALLLRGISEVENGWPEVEKSLEESLAEQAARLFRRIEYLAVIGNIAPMLGLLGTVTGMILAFQQVASSQGNAGAPELAQGIYSALVTTVAGLVIAIPSLAALAVFRNRVDEFVAEAAYLAQHAFAPIKRRTLAPAMPIAPPSALPTPPAMPGRRG